MSEVADPRVGAILENRYTIIRRIADGGMASVYLANDARLERTVAIKIIHQQLAQGPHRDQFLHRFHAEAKAAAALSNAHIVQVYDTGEFDGLPYIVMEYVHGVNLRQALAQTPTFSVRDTLRVLSETLDGLAAAHQAGLMHRDIKPENILINSRGHVQIADFGLAKTVSDATMSTTGLLLGTASYLAPEMIEQNRSTPQGDLYSVGIMGYEMLSGSVPFTSENPITTVFKHVHDDVPALSSVPGATFPATLVGFITKLTERDPSDRPADASAALLELRTAAGAIPREQLFYKYVPGEATQDQTSIIAPPPATQEEPTQNFLHASGAPVVDSAETEQKIAEDANRDNNQPPTPPSSHAYLPVKEPTMTTDPAASQQSPKAVQKKSHRTAIIISIVSVLVAIAAAIIVWWWFWGPGSYWVVPEASDKPCAQQSAACSLKGASYAEYKKTLAALGIDYSSTQQYSDTVEAGQIVSAHPDVDGHVTKRGGKLGLTVSKGIKKVTVPSDLLDCSVTTDAEAALKKLGFSAVKVTEVYSAESASGCALASSVDPGTTVAHNAPLTLTVSKGPKPVEIPKSLAGESQDTATAALNKLKLTVATKTEFSDSIAKGAVISVDPTEGQTVHWGDKVTLTVSKGPETVQMPNVVGSGTDAAIKKLEGLGLTVKTKASAIGENLHVVFSQSADAGKAVRLRDTAGKPTVITLTIV